MVVSPFGVVFYDFHHVILGQNRVPTYALGLNHAQRDIPRDFSPVAEAVPFGEFAD
jgi:hypothetical protein